MAINQQLILELTAKYNDAGLKAWKKGLSEAKEELSKAKEGTKEFANAGTKVNFFTGKILDSNSAIKGFSQSSKMSNFQLLEMGENLTVVAAGLMYAVNSAISFAKEIYDIGLKGAQLQNMRNYFEEMSGGITQATDNLNLLSSAAAGSLDEKQLIEFTNKMMALGYSIDDTAKIMDISETASDNLGISIESANDALLKFIQSGRGRGLYQYGIDVNEVNKKMREMSGLTEKQIKDLDSEVQERLRSQAVLSLYGRSLDDIKNKEKDNADQIESLKVSLKNISDTFAEGFAPAVAFAAKVLEGFINLTGSLKINLAATNQEMLKSQKVNEDTKKILDQLNISAENMAEAYKGIENAIYGMTKAQVDSATKFVRAELTKIEALEESMKAQQQLRYQNEYGLATYDAQKRASQEIEQFSRLTDIGVNKEKLRGLLGDLDSRGKFLDDVDKNKGKWSEKGKSETEEKSLTPSEQYKAKYEQWLEQRKYEKDLTLDNITLYNEEAKAKEKSAYLDYQADDKNKEKLKAWKDYQSVVEDSQKVIDNFEKAYIDASDKQYEKDKKRWEAEDKWKEERKKANDDLIKNQNSFKISKLEDPNKKIDSQLEEDNRQLDEKYKKELDLLRLEPTKLATLKKEIEEQKKLNKEIADYNRKKLEQEKIERRAKAIMDLSMQAFSNFGNVIATSGDKTDAFKNLLKSLLTSLITFIEAEFLAAKATMFFKAIISSGVTLTTDIVFSALGYAALEMAKGMIGALASGGTAYAGQPYWVGEAGMEMFIPRQTGSVISNKELKNFSNKKSQQPIYILTDVDHIGFMKVASPAFKKWKMSKKVS